MKTKFLLLFLLWAGVTLGQEFGNFKEIYEVSLLGFPKKSFKFSPKDSVIVNTKVNELFDRNGNVISYNKIQKKTGGKVSELDKSVLSSLDFKGNFWTHANIELKDDKVFIYPFSYSKKDSINKDKKIESLNRQYNIKIDKRNNFFKKNNVYLELDERHNYSFKYRTWQVGVVTIPIKWYMDSKTGNVETDINAMISVGRKFGKTHIVKLPHEKKARQYQRTFSVNLLAGISKLTFDESNTAKEDSIKGNVAAISTGVSLGVHYQDFTFLLASGFDFPTSNRKSWNFNNTPWIGLGFGYNFIKLASKTN